MDMLKFGKRVVFDRGHTTDQVLEDHLSQMRQHLTEHRMSKETRLAEEKEALENLMKYMDTEDQLKAKTREAMQIDFLENNKELHERKNNRIRQEIDQYK